MQALDVSGAPGRIRTHDPPGSYGPKLNPANKQINTLQRPPIPTVPTKRLNQSAKSLAKPRIWLHQVAAVDPLPPLIFPAPTPARPRLPS